MHEGYTMRDAKFWGMVISLGLASAYIFAVMYAFQPLLPILTQQFGISISYASTTMSIMTVGLIIGLLAIGFASDRYGREWFVKSAILIVAVPFVILPFVTDFAWVVVLRFVQGIALAGVIAVGLAYLGEEIHPKFRSTATALYISFNSIGGMLGRVLTGGLAEKHSWDFALYVLAATGIVIFIIILIFLPKSRNFMPSEVSVAKDVKGFLVHLKNPKLVIIFGFGMVLQMTFTSVWTYLPFYLNAAPFNWSLHRISFIYLTYGFGIVGAPLAGFLASKMGLPIVRTIGVATLVIGVIITMIPSTTGIIVGMCAICLGFFVAHSLMASTVTMEATHHKGSASSLYLVSYYIGVAIGSSAFSTIWESYHWQGITLLAASLPIVYSAITLITRKPHKKMT